MGTRLELHSELLNFAPKAYYQPPASVRLSYPCIVYKLSDVVSLRADNKAYKNFKSYEITYISQDPDDQKIEDILNHFQYCSLSRTDTVDNLYHYYFQLFY